MKKVQDIHECLADLIYSASIILVMWEPLFTWLGKLFCPLPWWAFIADRCHWLFHPYDCPGQCWQLHKNLAHTTSLQKL